MAKKAKPAEGGTLDIALKLIAEHGFNTLLFSDLAKAAQVPLAEIYQEFPTKSDILQALIHRTDVAVFEAVEYGDGEHPRDRLFDLLMKRFEVLLPYREALRVIYRDARQRPLGALGAAVALRRAMGWTLDASGLESESLKGRLRASALAAIYLSVLPVWLDDDDAGLARTMAALDRRLRRSGELLRGAWGEPAETKSDRGS